MTRTAVPWLTMTAGALLLAGCTSHAPPEGVFRQVELGHHFAGNAPVEATFVLVNGGTGDTLIFNSHRAAQRFLPASTFKIANTLIALETGVATGIDFTIAYDSLRDHRNGFWSAGWSRDHNLESAFRNSVYWYYQEIARRVGEARMREYLRRFDYGNQDIGGGLDRFWLHGDLRISALEQVGFLQRLHAGDLGVSKRSTDLLKDIMVLEHTDAYTLRGKTGTADVTATRELGWLVGSLERGSEVWYYALNMEGEEVWERWGNPTARRDLVLAILRELGVVP